MPHTAPLIHTRRWPRCWTCWGCFSTCTAKTHAPHGPVNTHPQMAKMLDVLEVFLNLHGHTYMRLDGSTRPEQRQILVQKFNTDPKVGVVDLLRWAKRRQWHGRWP